MVLPENAQDKPGRPASLPVDEDAWSLDDQDRPVQRRDSQALNRTAGMTEDETKVGAILCALLILGFAGIGVIFRDIHPEKATTEISECRQIDVGAERLACYDTFAREQETVPAKGAFPLVSSDQ